MTAAKGTSGTVRRGVFRFDPAHPLFADHFPGAPVVPGSCIVQAFADEAARWAREATDETTVGPDAADAMGSAGTDGDAVPLPLAGTPHRMQRIRPIRKVRGFRFRRFVTPGYHAFRMECTDAGLRCSLHALPHGHAVTEGHGLEGHGAVSPDVAEATSGSAPPLITGALEW